MKRIVCLTLVICSAGVASFLAPSNIDPAHKFSWGENLGWMNWLDANATNDGVVVGNDFLSGSIWTENAGWINVGAGASPYANTDDTDYGVNILGDTDLDGFAWSENLGWVNFGWGAGSGNPDRARFDSSAQRFFGWVWGENAGWINLDDNDKYVGAVLFDEIEPPLPAPPPHDILKNRYISIDPRGAGGGNVGKDLDIRLTLSSTQVNGVTAIGSEWWANAPDADCISIVSPSLPSVPPNWDSCPTLHLAGCPIIPTSTYDIVLFDGDLESEPLIGAATQAKPGVKWHGDCVGFFDGAFWTPPNGTTSIDDAVAAIKTFQDINAFNATHVSVTDMVPNLTPGPQINLIVNIADVFSIILGFQGQEYPGTDLTQCP